MFQVQAIRVVEPCLTNVNERVNEVAGLDDWCDLVGRCGWFRGGTIH